MIHTMDDGDKFAKEFQTYAIMLLIFKNLKEEPSYAYKLIKDLAEFTSGSLIVEEGYLYPILSKWVKLGYLDFTWHQTRNGQKRKKYSLTMAGINKFYSLKAEMKYLKDLLEK